MPGVRLAAPIVEGQALASSPFNASGVLVRGIRAADLAKLRSIANNIKQGTLDGFDDGQGIAIGSRLAEQLSLRAGDNITLVAPRGAVTPMGTTPRIKAYKIAAIFEIGMSEYDAAFVFMPLPEAQAYFNRAGDVTAIEVYTDDPDRIDRIPQARSPRRPRRPIYMIDWRQRNATFFNALQVERNVMFLILTLIVLVAALNIVSGLIMLVKDKGSDIAILRTMGATPGRDHAHLPHHRRRRSASSARWSAFLLGTVVCLNIESIRRFLSWLTNTELFSPELYFLSKLPADMNSGETTAVVVMALGLVAAGDALSVLARGAARSGRSAALRVIRRDGRENRDHRDPGAGRARRGAASVHLSARASAGNSIRAMPRSTCSRAPSLRCGPANRWRWSRRRAPANRRCCISPACSNIPTPARSISMASPPRI